MLKKIFLYLKNFDWILFFAVLLLVCFGLVEIYSVALGQDKVDLLNFRKQIVFAGIGIALLFFFAFVDYHNLRSFSNYIYIGGVVLLISVLLFGSVINGTRGWFNFFGFSLQPVEFIKIATIIFIARYFSSVSIKASPLKHFIISGIGVLILMLLVLGQPDFGSAVILFMIWLALVIMAGFDLKYLFVIGMISVLALGAGWLFFFKDYQKQRIMTFLNPAQDSLNEGYNITQAMIAIGAGQLYGKGVGFGSQSQLKFLPEAQNDFIFAVISEELGFLGVSLVLLFFSIIFYRLIKNTRCINNDFGIFFLLGAVALIFIQMFINIGMNIGIIPVIGIPLPFVSYGGSSIISGMILIGMAQNIIIKTRINY